MKYLVLGVVSLLIVLSMGFYAVSTGFVTFSSAKVLTDTVVSPQNSYIFLSPLRAKANGTERIRVTMFLLNSKGGAVPQVATSVRGGKDLIIEAVQAVTDNQGKAIYDVMSSTSGTFYLSISAQGQELLNIPTVQFDSL